MSRENRLIVAAIDFWTTYSGYAYSVKADYEVNPLKLYTSVWTDGSSPPTAKTPTVVLFDSNGKFNSFGYEAEAKYSQLSAKKEHEGWKYFSRFKMNLFNKRVRRTTYLTDDQNNRMLAIDVFAAAIRYFKDHLEQRMQKRLDDIRERDIYWILTVPAIWDDAAKQFMREAAVKAGIPEDRLDLALEPEAAALYCKETAISVAAEHHNQAELRSFNTGAQIMIMDLGGGTVDITIHEVQLDGTLRELCAPSGGPWGGTLVDKHIFQLLEEIFGKDVTTKFKDEYTSEMLDLERAVELKKRVFKQAASQEGETNVQLNVPSEMFKTFKAERGEKFDLYLSRSSFASTVKKKSSKLLISQDTFSKVFDSSVQGITSHVRSLLQKPELKDVKTIMMVGGFAESKVIQMEIKNMFSDKTVKIPEEAGTAVVNGAVIFGFKADAISSRVLRFSYGVSTSVPFDIRYHPESKRFLGRCEVVFETFLRAGLEIVPRETIVSRTLNSRSSAGSIEIYRSPSEEPMFISDPENVRIGEMKLELLREPEGEQNLIEVSMWLDTSLHVKARELETDNKVSAKFDFL